MVIFFIFFKYWKLFSLFARGFLQQVVAQLVNITHKIQKCSAQHCVTTIIKGSDKITLTFFVILLLLLCLPLSINVTKSEIK